MNVPHRLILLPLLAVSTMSIAACGSDSTDSPATPTTDAMMTDTTDAMMTDTTGG